MPSAELLQRLSHPSIRLFLQLIVILILARGFFVMLRRLRQPAVVGEVLAGIVLGPTVLGALFPGFHEFLFPAGSLPPLELLSDLGIVLFLFLVGMEMDLDQVSTRLGQSIAVSLGGVTVSCLFGIGVGLLLHPVHGGRGPVLPFALFMGIAMSITAFPVLARIIRERNLSRSPAGMVALSAAAVGDVLAWCMLALVIGLAQSHSMWSSAFVTLGAAAFTLFMFLVVRPLFARMGALYITREVIGRGVMTLTILILLASALISHMLGIHALFGAFLAGAVLPRETRLRAVLSERIEDFISILLLPVFFALTGLRTDLGFLLHPENWDALALILGAAILGKVIGSGLPARLSGLGWKEAGIVGTLMNTRGLVEIIILNVGFELGILPASVFAMMVVMALVTTFMTGPALQLFQKKGPPATVLPGQEAGQAVLVAFGPPASGRRLLGVAALVADRVVALHVSRISESGLAERELSDGEVFGSLLSEADLTQTIAEPLHRRTGDLAGTIAVEAERYQTPLVLIGSARSLFAADVLGGRVAEMLRRIPNTLGVFVDRGLGAKPAVTVIWRGPADDFLVALWRRGRAGLRSRFQLLDVSQDGSTRPAAPSSAHWEVLPRQGEDGGALPSGAGTLIVVSTETYARWPDQSTGNRQSAALDLEAASLLIVRPARAV